MRPDVLPLVLNFPENRFGILENMKSPKEYALEKTILRTLAPHSMACRLAERLFSDEELQSMQEYANIVSIRRLGYNDHGPVHMRQVAYNSLRMLDLLHRSGVKTSLEKDEAGGYEESLCAVLLAAMLHDLGMSVGRQNHENHSAILALPFIDRHLPPVLPSLDRSVPVKAMAVEGIVGHMGSTRVHSIEAGLILAGDGCDMEKGRARITMDVHRESRVGDIHKYSANAISCVKIMQGSARPVLIDVEMEGEVGFFQIEEVLMQKIAMSPVQDYVELLAGVSGQSRKKYL